MKKLLNPVIRLVFHYAYPVIQFYWQLIEKETHGTQILLWVNDQLLLIKNSYRNGYGLPGGHINLDETAHQAIIRELKEETGITISNHQLKHITTLHFYRGKALCTDDIFQCSLESMPKVQIDNREVIEYQFVSLTKINTLPLLKETRHIINYEI